MSMFGGNMAPSLSDIAAVTGNRNNDGFGDGNGWWVLIILFALFGGWGNNGYGNSNGGQGAYDTQAAVQRGFDTQAIISKLDGINAGICSLGYDQLAQMNGINNTVMQTGFGLQNSINQLGVSNMQDTFGLQQSINANNVANMQNTNAISRQLAECCCENRAALADIKYTMATDACALNTNIHQTGDAIINNQNQNFQMLNQTIRDGFCNLEMREMQRENADLRQKLNNCDRDNALQGTASYIINSVRPTPIPAWPVNNPWGCCNNSVQFSNGCNAGCCGSQGCC